MNDTLVPCAGLGLELDENRDCGSNIAEFAQTGVLGDQKKQESDKRTLQPRADIWTSDPALEKHLNQPCWWQRAADTFAPTTPRPVSLESMFSSTVGRRSLTESVCSSPTIDPVCDILFA